MSRGPIRTYQPATRGGGRERDIKRQQLLPNFRLIKSGGRESTKLAGAQRPFNARLPLRTFALGALVFFFRSPGRRSNWRIALESLSLSLVIFNTTTSSSFFLFDRGVCACNYRAVFRRLLYYRKMETQRAFVEESHARVTVLGLQALTRDFLENIK